MSTYVLSDCRGCLEHTWTPLWNASAGAEPAGCCTADRPAGGGGAGTAGLTERDWGPTLAGPSEPTPPAGPGNQWRRAAGTERVSVWVILIILTEITVKSDETFTRWGWGCRTLRIQPTDRTFSAETHLLVWNTKSWTKTVFVSCYVDIQSFLGPYHSK